jgi:hypothetical protein
MSKAMTRYDPLQPPDPEEWLSTEEGERILLAQEYHERARVRLPNVKVHAVMHVIVENQIALGDELPVRRAVDRLVAEGLDRHDALHAIGSVLTQFMFDIMNMGSPQSAADPNRDYFAALERLTAEDCLRSG